MAVEKVGIYRKWLEPVPKDKNGKCAAKSEWPRKRRHRWIARWYGTNGQRYGKVFQSRKEKESAEILEWEPKSRTNRVVPMSDQTLGLLVNMQVDAPEFHPYVFVSPERLCRIKRRREAGRWHARSQVVNRLREGFDTIRRRAKVSECTIHDLRRSAITNWAQRLPIQVVQVLAGHADIRTTRKYYLAIRPEDFSSAVEVLKHIMSETATD
jgi:integrase